MYPYLFTIAGQPISTYGVLVVLGMAAGVLVTEWLARSDRLDGKRVFIVSWLAIFAGMAGARLMYVCTQLPYFLEHPLDILRFWNGWAFLGGLLAAYVAVLGYVQFFPMPVWKILDALSPGITLGLMFGRIGCLMGGCCFGKPTGCAFGIRQYGTNVDPELRGVPLHPTQLYEAVALLVLFCWLLRVFNRQAFDGQVFLLLFLAYPVLRGIIECFRGDAIRGSVFQNSLSTSQFVGILMFVPAALMYRIRSKGGLKCPQYLQPMPETPVHASPSLCAKITARSD
jgi:phosphatidylglycerol:prolipoprotein diacylglycerol transferase